MLTLKSLAKYYHDNGQVVKALDDISLTFNEGEFVVITGESGSGKSTLLNVISGLDSYEAGDLLFMKEETAYYAQSDWEQYRKNNIGFIFQNYNLIDSYTVYQNVAVAAMIKGEDEKTYKEKVLTLIERVGLKGKEHQKASTLSGGEKQRVAIARALAKDAPIIIADEPTGNLDSKTSDQIMTLLEEVSKDKLVLMVSHSFESVKAQATRHIKLADGGVVLDKNLKKPNTSQITPTLHETKTLSFMSLIKLGLKNLWATPKKTIFTFLIALFVVSVFALIYGAYVQQTNTVGGQSSRNPNRVMITKTDGEPFTNQEMNHYRSLDNVIEVIAYDALFDLEAQTVFDFTNDPYRNIMFYANVNHMSVLSARDLEEGRLPEQDHEIVIGARYHNISLNDTLDLTVNEYHRFDEEGANIPTKTYEVVGIIEERSYRQTIYFHPSFFNDASNIATALFHANISPKGVMHMGEDSVVINSVYIDDALPLGTINIQERLSTQLGNGISPGDNVVFDMFDHLHDEPLTNTLEINQLVSNQDHYHDVAISSDTLIMYYASVPAYQLTLLVEDNFAANQVLSQLDDQTINSMYPAGVGGYFDPIGQAIGNLMLGVLSILVLFIMYVVSFITLRNIMEAKGKDYVILRSLGLFKKDLNIMSIFELMVIMFVATFTIMMLLLVNRVYIFLPNYLRFYQFSNYLFMGIALLLLAFFLALRFNRQMFNRSVISAFKEQG